MTANYGYGCHGSYRKPGQPGCLEGSTRGAPWRCWCAWMVMVDPGDSYEMLPECRISSARNLANVSDSTPPTSHSAHIHNHLRRWNPQQNALLPWFTSGHVSNISNPWDAPNKPQLHHFQSNQRCSGAKVPQIGSQPGRVSPQK